MMLTTTITKLPPDPILTPKEIADYLKLSRSAVYEMLQRREMDSIKAGKSVRVRRSVLEAWMEANTLKAAA